MSETVRQKVEAILREQYPLQNLATDADLPEIIGQLRTRQIDLETAQNEYINFFNFAPVGCLTLDEKGLILDVNLISAEMLQQKPELLSNKPLTVYLDSDSHPIFARHLETVFTSGRRESCELILKTQDNAKTYLQLRSIVWQQGETQLCHTTMTDITERKQIELSLQESEALNRAIIDGLSANIAVLDEAGDIIAVNQHWLKFGAENEADLAGGINAGVNYLAVCRASAGQEDPVAQQALDGIEAILQGKSGMFELEYPCHAPHEQRWYIMRVTPLRGAQRGAIVAHQKITERKQLEETLRENEARFRLLTEKASDLICLHQPDGRYLYLSPSCERLLGYKPEELVGQNPYELFHPEDIERIQTEAHDRARRGKEIASITYRVRRKSGEYIWFETHTQPVLNNHGQVTRLITASRDVTERKQAELALQEERALLAQRVEERTTELVWLNQRLLKSHQVTEALYEFDRVLMSCQDAPTLLETSATQIAQILPADRVYIYLLNMQTRQVTHFAKGGPDVASTSQVTFAELWEGLTGWVIRQRKPALSDGNTPDARESEAVQQSRLERKAGATLVVPLEYQEQIMGTLTAIKPQDEEPFTNDELEMVQSMADRLVLALRNINLTDSLRARTTELSTANAELARAARLKDEFLANMSHELRTPLNAILGMSEVLQMETFGNLNDKQRGSLKHIEDGGRHLLSLINDILDLSKIEAGRLELNLETVPVEDVCQSSLRFVQQQALKKQIELISDFDDNVKTLEVDERRLKQILVNLLTNAVKFTPSGGQVGLDVRRDADKSAVNFTVWDTGVGISEADLQKLFQPFVQLDSSLAREHEGTGLGLALVYRLAELHGGSVTVESQVGQGSRFTVSIPWRSIAVFRGKTDLPQVEPPVPIGVSDATGLPHPLILLAEDNQANLTLVQEWLQAHGYQIVVARNGYEAVELAREEKPGLILMDIQMPGMDGLEAIQRIRADTEATVAQAPIIALTALAMAGDKERCLEAGANAYLSKPASMRQLLELIEAYLAREPAMAPAKGTDK